MTQREYKTLWAEVALDRHFDDIKIVDLDLKKTTWSRVHESLRVVFLKLNHAPPEGVWRQLFFEERCSRINGKRLGLWVEDDYISFDCKLSEVASVHLPDILQSIEFANKNFHIYLAGKRAERKQSQNEAIQEQLDLEALRKEIRQQTE